MVYIPIRSASVDDADIPVNGIIINNLARTPVKKVISRI